MLYRPDRGWGFAEKREAVAHPGIALVQLEERIMNGAPRRIASQHHPSRWRSPDGSPPHPVAHQKHEAGNEDDAAERRCRYCSLVDRDLEDLEGCVSDRRVGPERAIEEGRRVVPDRSASLSVRC